MEITDQMRTVLTGHRQTRWVAWLCDETDALVRELDEFAGGSLENDRNADIRGGGSIELRSAPGEGAPDIDWGSARIRIEQHITGLDPTPWGVYLPEVPEVTWHDEQGTMACTVSLMDKTVIPSQDQPTDTYSLAAGTNIVATVVSILTSLGETRVAAEESSLTLPADRSWPVDEDTSWLTIINDLLSVAGYYALWCDAEGIYQIGPNRPSSSDDTPAWTFTYGGDGHGGSSLYQPEWQQSEDWYSVPNRVILVSQGDDETPALTATATNTDPASKYSTVSRGRVITTKETGVEAADLATLTALARTRLESLTTSVTNINITTAPLPLWPNDRVDLVTPSRDGRVACTVSSWSISLEPGGLMEHSWREVVSLA